MAAVLTQPATLILLLANLVPLVGVVAWGWDAFLLLMLYWLETAVIAFWAVVRIAFISPAALADIKLDNAYRPVAPLALAAFVSLHAGVFMGVHFAFLWALFSNEWPRQVRGAASFVDRVVIETGLWIPLLALFVGRGALMMLEALEPALRRLARLPPRPAERTAPGPVETVLLGLYLRIVVMQVTIIFGGFVALLIGSAAAYALLVAVKTAVDIGFQAVSDALRRAWRKARASAERP